MVYKFKNELVNLEVIIYINLIIFFSVMYVYFLVICRFIWVLKNIMNEVDERVEFI